MMKEDQGPREKKTSETTVVDKKLYKKPSFQYERVFETTALACGKIVGTQGSCKGRRKS
jgi:hypothetical protein